MLRTRRLNEKSSITGSHTSTYYPGLDHCVQYIDECNDVNPEVLREVEWYNMILIAPDSKYHLRLYELCV